MRRRLVESCVSVMNRRFLRFLTRLNRAVALVRRYLEVRLQRANSSPMRASHRTR